MMESFKRFGHVVMGFGESVASGSASPLIIAKDEGRADACERANPVGVMAIWMVHLHRRLG